MLITRLTDKNKDSLEKALKLRVAIIQFKDENNNLCELSPINYYKNGYGFNNRLYNTKKDLENDLKKLLEEQGFKDKVSDIELDLNNSLHLDLDEIETDVIILKIDDEKDQYNDITGSLYLWDKGLFDITFIEDDETVIHTFNGDLVHLRAVYDNIKSFNSIIPDIEMNCEQQDGDIMIYLECSARDFVKNKNLKIENGKELMKYLETNDYS